VHHKKSSLYHSNTIPNTKFERIKSHKENPFEIYKNSNKKLSKNQVEIKCPKSYLVRVKKRVKKNLNAIQQEIGNKGEALKEVKIPF
jgi:hypothetical protein